MANNQRDNKRRRVEASTVSSRGPSAALRLTEAPSAAGLPAHPSLPAKPGFAQSANALGLGAKSDTDAAVAALGGSNHDVVANRAAIRMANMSAAEMLKAEMAGLTALKPSTPTSKAQATAPTPKEETVDMDVEGDVPGFGASDTPSAQLTEPVPVKGEELTTNEVMNNGTSCLHMCVPAG
jgi:5'-3' exoribonuclease 2